MSSKKAKPPKQSVLQNQVASLKIGTSRQKSSQPPSFNEIHKAKARTTYPIASPNLQKHSYSDITRSSGAAQDRSNKGPLQKVTSKQWNTQSQKPTVSAKTPRWPSQLNSIESKGQPKSVTSRQIPSRPAKPRADNSARKPFQPLHSGTVPDEDYSSKSKAEPRAIGYTQQHSIPGPDPFKFDVTYTRTNRGLNSEQTKHTTVAKAQLPYHSRSSSIISHDRRRQSITHQDRQQLLESEEDNSAKNDYRQRKSPTGS